MSDEEVVEEEPTVEDQQEPSVEDQLAEALARAEKAEAEITYRDADIVNLRRRAASDKMNLMKFAGFSLAGRILPVLDSLERALKSAEEGPFTEGIQLTRDNLLEALEAEGVKPIEVQDIFDPSTMEAITTLPSSEEHPEGTVVDTLESGYLYKDRVLRPARVVVAKD